jgi:3-deoxy-D-manno-octulosonate 8-phosphate phosphatase (KDO 8-P phosphatase)
MNRPAPVPGRARPDAAQLAAIEFLLLDVDGVLTDGRIWFDHEGREYKQFHVHDASGLVQWHRLGGRSGLLSGRGGEGIDRRAHELGVHELLLRRTDKTEAFDELLQRQGLDAQQVAYVGDDLLDLPVMWRVGFAATVPQARPEALAAAHFVSARAAGFGAVRDVVEELLRARGRWDEVVAKGGRP